jgi:hypothetical protein
VLQKQKEDVQPCDVDTRPKSEVSSVEDTLYEGVQKVESYGSLTNGVKSTIKLNKNDISSKNVRDGTVLDELVSNLNGYNINDIEKLEIEYIQGDESFERKMEEAGGLLTYISQKGDRFEVKVHMGDGTIVEMNKYSYGGTSYEIRHPSKLAENEGNGNAGLPKGVTDAFEMQAKLEPVNQNREFVANKA